MIAATYGATERTSKKGIVHFHGSRSRNDFTLWGSGRNFDFCYGSGVKTKPGAKINGIVAMALPLDGAQGTDHTFANHYEGETFGLE